MPAKRNRPAGASQKKQSGVWLPPQVWKWVKHAAADHDVNQSEMIEMALRSWFEKRGYRWYGADEDK